ncbi:MAG: protein kinase [Bdellovibrionota bacterium]
MPSLNEPTFTKRSETLECYLRERGVLKTLVEQPGVVRLLGHDDSKNELLLSLAPGDSLQSKFEFGHRFEVEEALAIVTSLSRSLTHIHSLGLVHWDLTPGNVMHSDNSVTLIDFGISYSISSIPNEFYSGEIGTPQYRSPEHVKGQPQYGQASDIFNLGVLWYEMLASSAPFDPVLGNINDQILRYEPDMPKRSDATTQRLLKALMNKDHTKRPSAAQVLQFLET